MKISTFIAAPSDTNMTRLDIITSIYHDWKPIELRDSGMIELKLLSWSPVWFIGQLVAIGSEHQIERNGITYDVRFYNCELNDINRASKVWLSFRACKELDLNVVLVKFSYNH